MATSVVVIGMGNVRVVRVPHGIEPEMI